MTTVTAPPGTGDAGRDVRAPRPAHLSERARDEQRLGWYLVAPAVVVMLAVTAYPLGRAVYLSLYSYRLTDPAAKEFVGLRNYGVVLTDSLWWQDVFTTVFITVVTVAVELVIGFAFATVMHRIIFGRRTVRTAILIPYGIITVVAAFAWQYAFALDSGFVNEWFGLGDKAWFSDRWSALAVIILAEVWKTTPFISLLLLAGLAQVPEELQEAAKVDGATRVAAAVAGDDSQHEGRDPGGAPVPHARRLPHLRHHLHHDRRRREDRELVDPRLPPDHHPHRTGPGRRGVGAAVPLRDAHCLRDHSGLQRGPGTGEGGLR